MEILTELRTEGKRINGSVEAYCSVCKEWISEVEIIEGCHPGNRTYAHCPDCKTGIIRSEPCPHQNV